jgi:hypothetical protein
MGLTFSWQWVSRVWRAWHNSHCQFLHVRARYESYYSLLYNRHYRK